MYHPPRKNDAVNATTITDITAVSSDQWLVMDAAVLQSVASHPALQLMEPLIMG